MPETNVMSRLGFLDLDPSIDPKHQSAHNGARDHAASIVRQLREFGDDIRRGDFTPEGKQRRLHDGLAEAGKALGASFAPARSMVDAARGTAQRSLQGRLWGGVDRPERLGPAQASLGAIARGDPVPPKYPVNERGHAMLEAGGKTTSSLADLITRAPLDDARVVFLAANRSDPVTRHLLGGQPVLDAMAHAVTARVAKEDPEAAAYVAEISQADALLSMIDGDLRSAMQYAARTIGLPKEAADALLRPDPIREQAQRRAS
jgi:hypothetical protein